MMKAEISAHGTLELKPETSTEAYALKTWKNNNWVKMEDIVRAEDGHFRGSSIAINPPLKD